MPLNFVKSMENTLERLCKTCGITKPFTVEFFNSKYGKPIGCVCRACLNLAIIPALDNIKKGNKYEAT